MGWELLFSDKGSSLRPLDYSVPVLASLKVSLCGGHSYNLLVALEKKLLNTSSASLLMMRSVTIQPGGEGAHGPYFQFIHLGGKTGLLKYNSAVYKSSHGRLEGKAGRWNPITPHPRLPM